MGVSRITSYGIALALSVCLLSVPVSLADNPFLQGPESGSLCKIDSDCPPPTLSQDQVRECLEARCIRGSCAAVILTGKSLNEATTPSRLSCYAEPVVCSDQGKKTTLSDPSRRVAANEGNICLPSLPIANPCQEARCSNKECVPKSRANSENFACANPNPAAGPCGKGLCRDGQCKPAPDPAKQGTSCAEDEKKVCRTTKHTCSNAGSCDPKTTVDDGKECSPDPDGAGPERALLGQPASLPAPFLALFQGGSKPPSYNCNATGCTLEYCGNGKVDQPSEDCDGDAYRDGVARNLPCNKDTCKTGSIPPIGTCSASSFNPRAPEGVTILSEDFLICGTKGPINCGDMRPAAEARKSELLAQGYHAVVTGGLVTCDPWRGNPCQGAEPSRWALHEARVCYYSVCGDGKITPNEECDGSSFKGVVEKGATCDPKTCKVIPPPNELSCGDLSLSVSETLNRQWGLFDISISLSNKKDGVFQGHNGVAYIVIDQPQGFASQRAVNPMGNSWYDKNNWSCANLPTDPSTGLLINPEGKPSSSAWGCFKFYPEDAKKLLDSGSAVRDDNNPEFLIANSSITAAAYQGTTRPAIRLDSIPAIPAKGSWTATSNAKVFNPTRNPDIVNNFSGRLVCEPLDTCGDGKKGPSEECDGSVPAGLVEGSTCSNNCVIEFCGDGIINRDEECDGDLFRKDRPAGATCDPKSCRVVEKQCTWIAAFADWGLGVAGRAPSDTSLLQYARNERTNDWRYVPSCFLEKYQPLCKQRASGFDDTVGYTVFGSCSELAPTELANFLGVPQETAALAICNYLGPRSAQGQGRNSTLPQGCKPDSSKPIQFYMDESCRYAPPKAGVTVCGFAGVSWSPISLLVKPEVALEKDSTVVQFPLDPTLPASFSLWKASESAPLLVYDPDGTGAVTSARQLFGNYTFGGKTTNIADAKSSTLRSPWSNGYEALGLLDTNHDDVVSGDELKPLALWLDKNRDGISDKDEVVPAREFGITQLFYKNSLNVPNSKDVKLEKGFTRVVDSKELSGPSVDWFGETFTNRLEAAQALEAKLRAAMPRETMDALVSSLPEELRGNPLTFKPHQATDHSSDLSGYWLWHTKDKDGANHPGVFALEQKGDRVFGYNIVEAILADNKTGLKSSVRIIPAEGTITVSPNGERTLSMKLIDVTGEGTAVSTATLTSTGNSLSGKTRQEIIASGGDSPQSVSTEYEWTAVKFASDKAKQ